MYSGICICMFLAVLSMGCFGQQTTGSNNDSLMAGDTEQRFTTHERHVRAAPSSGQLKPFPKLEGNPDQRANLGALLTKYLQQARRGSSGRYALLGSKAQNLDSNHRINDRDYMGWMDFGRRSAEEYEYSS
ncbi:cholecystokinin [Latimeria chalumnae]|uniref:Cholecystokinin n=1 Tax=Latimeria chalumnae TaxID=7897 RepID=H2ZX16_LATCH|nr:PREDICTED: cholecystokinin [Latimeria chalumnae]|eukprot:XP_006013099.1 PREDICTED: cholecystokinin [Latimeria chalumnae]